MAAPSDGAHSAVFSSRFDDSDAFSEAVHGAAIEFAPLPAHRYHAELVSIALGDVRLQQSSMSPNRARGSVDPASASILLLTEPTPGILVNGRPLGREHVALLRPGEEFQGLAPAGLSWASITIDLASFDALCNAWQLQATARDTLLAGAEMASLDPLRQGVAAVADLAKTLPATFADASVAAALSGALIDLLSAARFERSAEPTRSLRTAEAMRIVTRAEDYLASRLSQPIYSHELSRALGVSERSLFGAFAAVCGTSPHAYLKFRRLLLVRRALRNGGGDARQVKSVALAHGFWHFGNFARDYRLAFGENPSQTLQHARGGQYGPDTAGLRAAALIGQAVPAF